MSSKPSAKWSSAVLSAAAIADHSTRALLTDKLTGLAYLDVAVGGQLDYIEIMVYPIATDGVPSGGLFEIENKSVDWKPFNVYSDSFTILTTTGARITPLRIPTKKWIPDNSKIIVYYTANNAAADMPTVTFHWILGVQPSGQYFMDAAKGSALTAITQAAKHVQFQCPAGKGGTARAIMAIPIGTPETIVCGGGVCDVTNTAADWIPTQFVTGTVTGKTTMSGEVKNHIIDLNHPLLGNSYTYIAYTPVDNQSQLLQATIIWESN